MSVSQTVATAPAQSRTLPCLSADADLFFSESPRDLERAKTLCATCPVQQQCLAEALERGEPWGVWGGQIIVEGRPVAAKRGRGRPRKHAV